ncbi:hypothetical protein ACOMHN_057831 [Nucella lapillus]
MADVRLFLSSRHHYILLAGFLGLVISDVTTSMTSSLWNRAYKNMVTSSVATSNTSRGALRCVMDCHQMESCVSLAYDPESDICYLQPTYRPARQGDDGPLDVYTREKGRETMDHWTSTPGRKVLCCVVLCCMARQGDHGPLDVYTREKGVVLCCVVLCCMARQGDDGPLDVYTMERVAACKPRDAPDITNAHVTKWTVTPSSLDVDVSCDADYMLSKDVTSQVRCRLDNGVWTTLMAATCKQFAWRNYTVKVDHAVHSLPRPATVGLCVRVTGTPTSNTIFAVGLETSRGDYVARVAPRLNDNGDIKTTIFNYRLNGRWGREVRLKDPSPPFPFAVGAPFKLAITAVSVYKFNVQVNGAHYGDFTAVQPVTDVTKVSVYATVSVESVIIGC